MERTATCVCGQLSALCKSEPARVSLCHCLACQKRTGSTYGIAAFFRREDVESKGHAQQYTRSSIAAMRLRSISAQPAAQRSFGSRIAKQT
jgi:hypothetical protein